MFKFIEKHQHLFSIIIPVVAGLIFLSLACLNLTSSIWFDEAYSAYLTKGSFSEIWQLTGIDVHPPLFYFCLKIWSTLFGTTDFAMRFMSVFFGLIAIVFAFQCLKRWFGIKSATIATLVMSVAPMFIRYGQEMRMYTLLLAIVCAATYFLTLALDTKSRKYWLVYGLLVSLGMWTHYFAALVWLAHLAYIIYIYGGIKNTLKDKNIIISYILAVALYLPWIPSFLHQVIDVEGGFWVGEASLVTPLDYLSESLVYKTAGDAKTWLAVLVIALITLVAIFATKTFKQATKEERKCHLLILSIALLPPVLLTILSLPPLRPLFVNRYTSYSAVFLWVFFGLILAAAFAKRLGRPAARIALAAVVILTACLGIIHVETREPSGYGKEIVETVQALADEGEPIFAATDWIYYDTYFYNSDTHPIYLANNWTEYQWGSLIPIKTYHLNVVDDLPAFFAEHPTFWIIADTPAHDQALQLPDEVKDLRVLTSVANSHHTALELTTEP